MGQSNCPRRALKMLPAGEKQQMAAPHLLQEECSDSTQAGAQRVQRAEEAGAKSLQCTERCTGLVELKGTSVAA